MYTPLEKNTGQTQMTVTEGCISDRAYILTSTLLIQNAEQRDGVTYVCQTDDAVTISRNISIIINSKQLYKHT